MTLEQEKLIVEAYPIVKGLVYGKFRNIVCSEELEDRVSIIMLKLMEEVHKYDPSRAGLSTWVTLITYTQLLVMHKSYKANFDCSNGQILSLDHEYEVGEGGTTLADFLEAEVEDALQNVYEAQIWKAAQPIIDKMQESMRTSFIYVAILGYSVSETARIRKLSCQAVSIHVIKARRRLKKALAGFDRDPNKSQK